MNELKQIKRNELGLIEGFEYKFTPEGTIDWRALTKQEYLYPNPQNKDKIAEKYGKKYEELDVVKDNIEDIDLVIKLGGLRFLSAIRGFNSIEYRPIVSTPDYASTVCSIFWIPNYEVENRHIHFEAIASASPMTTKGFGQNYLAEMSENRAFCRCCRQFLNINIVSNFELQVDKLVEDPPQNNTNNILDPHQTLSKILDNKGADFEKLKRRCSSKEKNPKWYIDGAENWKELKDIPKDKVLGLIEKLNG